jgi:hypothetical protein
MKLHMGSYILTKFDTNSLILTLSKATVKIYSYLILLVFGFGFTKLLLFASYTLLIILLPIEVIISIRSFLFLDSEKI